MVEARIMSVEGTEITDYDQPGELVVRSPSVVLGYLNNDEANKDTFQDGWMHTGDVAVIRKGPKGTEHCFVVDRLKELIKVKVHIWFLVKPHRPRSESPRFSNPDMFLGNASGACRTRSTPPHSPSSR